MSAEAFRSRIGSAMANRDFAEVEAAWREYASLDPEAYPYLLNIAGQLTRHDKGALAGELCLALSQSLLEKDDTEGALQSARASLKASQRTEGLRELLIAVHKKRDADNVNLDLFLEKSGLSAEGGNLRTQIDQLEKFLTFAEDAYVYHRGGWGFGQVVEFDPDEEELVVDFQRKSGHKMKIVNATKILERLPADHIGIYKYFRREELDQLVKEDPAKVFHLYLASHGREATLKQVREEFVPEVMDKTAWSRWWTKSKKALLRDPAIRIGKGSSPLLELRDEEKTIEDEVVDRMKALMDGHQKCALAREYMRALDMTDALADAIGGEVNRSLEGVDEPTADRLALLYLKSDLKKEGAEEAAADARAMLSATAEVGEMISPLEPADRKRAVQEIAADGEDGWAEKLLGLLRDGDGEIADVAMEALRTRRPDVAIAFLSELTSSPRKNPQIFLWYVRGFINGTLPHELAPGEKTTTAMEKLLTLANVIGLEQRRSGDADLKEFLRQVRSFLSARRLKTFREFVAGTNLSYARFLYTKIQRNRGFTDQSKGVLLDVIEGEFPDIHTAAEDAEEATIAQPTGDVIYTTILGYLSKEAERKHIVDEEIPQNAEDLGRAASFGDISENAEYSAALEKQERLMRRLREVSDDLERARLLEIDEIGTDRVVIGTHVELRNTDTNEEKNFILLGPWDADIDRGIISYMSPVGRGLLGKKVGAKAEIELPEGKVNYEVLSIAVAPENLLVRADDN
ncbi:MAG: transcription elongation factor GreA [Planctomycetota bacterium]|jgi:transcription elongation factor GreA